MRVEIKLAGSELLPVMFIGMRFIHEGGTGGDHDDMITYHKLSLLPRIGGWNKPVIFPVRNFLLRDIQLAAGHIPAPRPNSLLKECDYREFKPISKRARPSNSKGKNG
jgi:hypothetical protein